MRTKGKVNKKIKQTEGITLIALVITIIVLLILAGISIAMLTGDNGLLTKAKESEIKTDIATTKEQIKIEIMGNLSENGKYTNTDVVNAVRKVTDREISEKAPSVESKKGNSVDLSDLWLGDVGALSGIAKAVVFKSGTYRHDGGYAIPAFASCLFYSDGDLEWMVDGRKPIEGKKYTIVDDVRITGEPASSQEDYGFGIEPL